MWGEREETMNYRMIIKVQFKNCRSLVCVFCSFCRCHSNDFQFISGGLPNNSFFCVNGKLYDFWHARDTL